MIVYATSSRNKASLVLRLAAEPIEVIDLELTELQSLSFEVVVGYKARQAFSIVKRPVIVSDSGIIFNALGSLPGPLSKWFVDSLGVEGMARMLDSYSDRTAMAVTCFAYFDGNDLRISRAERKAMVAYSIPSGNRWGGWADLMIYEGCDKVWPELSFEEQAQVSTMHDAFLSIEKYLLKSGYYV